MNRLFDTWFSARGWKPFKFQKQVWQAISKGHSGLLHATTGAGKTYAVWIGALLAFGKTSQKKSKTSTHKNLAAKQREPISPPLTLLWVTPMRALASDTLRALQLPLLSLKNSELQADESYDNLELWSIGIRSGDTSSAERATQNRKFPTVLITTPESLSLLLSRPTAQQDLKSAQIVVVDEWHELLGNKRGVQVQLALARLKKWNPALCIWGMSATLGNLQEAMHTLLGHDQGTLVQGSTPKKLIVDSLLPTKAERFAWSGHLGLTMLPQVVAEIAQSPSTLIFTNTRSQAELWYQALLKDRPDWAGSIALHHASLDRELREWVELNLKNGQLKAVVCTSSLDLGVDFLPVERVLQIGSPKGIARLLQRAGRSGHAPGRVSRITLVPTHSIEIIEAAASRLAIKQGHIETRSAPKQPLDVLVQHLITIALGGGFLAKELYEEVCTTIAYRDLSPENWQWALNFVAQGGTSLTAYPDYRRAVPDKDGIWRVPDARLARRHRMNIGTIVSDASITVQYVGGAKLGTVEENFVARLKKGDCFLFGGRLLELVRIHEMTAWVKRVSSAKPAVPRWNGGRMPLSSTLADAVVQQLTLASRGCYQTPELQCIRPLLEVQEKWSALPTAEILLAETLKSREGWHLFLYPFAGRQVHLGLANLLAWRTAQYTPSTFSIAVNDYGLELLSATELEWGSLLPQVLSPTSSSFEQPQEEQKMPPEKTEKYTLLNEILASLNASELAKRRFREIARISGLIFQNYPHEKRGSRQLQASSSLFYEVFRKYDPSNRLLLQAEEELLAQELDIDRLNASLKHMSAQPLVLKHLVRPTPFAFPLMVERFREKLSNESAAQRVARMVEQLEKAAGNKSPSSSAEQVKEKLLFGQEPSSIIKRTKRQKNTPSALLSSEQAS
ncbi:MAG: ligase-associated DNA damage response DEXH box helicase [Burkholderiaceae bacterium]|nr:ligase-associated DNA damage response DEXH box helicase [Burkholderiaceae bacterium]